MVLVFKATLGFFITILTIGVLLPYMISAASTELVLLGLLGASFMAFSGLYYGFVQVKNLLTEKEEKNV